MQEDVCTWLATTMTLPTMSKSRGVLPPLGWHSLNSTVPLVLSTWNLYMAVCVHACARATRGVWGGIVRNTHPMRHPVEYANNVSQHETFWSAEHVWQEPPPVLRACRRWAQEVIGSGCSQQALVAPKRQTACANQPPHASASCLGENGKAYATNTTQRPKQVSRASTGPKNQQPK